MPEVHCPPHNSGKPGRWAVGAMRKLSGECPSPIYPATAGPWGQVGHETLTKYRPMANLTVTEIVTHHLLTSHVTKGY